MTDIVERLRAPKEAVQYIEAQVPFTCSVLSSDNVATMAEAADEIEHLREAVKELKAEVAILVGRIDQMGDALAHCDDVLEFVWPHFGGADANKIAACQDHVVFVLNVHGALKRDTEKSL